ncbi:MAG: HAD hydrolase family protein [Mollicutes bacterium]|nr:HAD hydrolase family protein [Mollicutes bacterium]
MRKTIIAVDFDGTICEDEFPNIGAIRKNCAEVIKRLQNEGVIVILWTCRQGKHLDSAIRFCHNNGIYPDYINENYPGLPFKTSNKIYADYYIDDKAQGIDWKENYSIISNYKQIPFIEV